MPRDKTALGSLGVAAIALVLSQFKPIPEYFQHPILDVELSTAMGMGHHIGDVFIHPFIQVANRGDAVGKIESVEYYIENDRGTPLRRLPAQMYFPKPTSISPGQPALKIPLSDIILKPGDSWDNYLSAFETPTPAKQAKTTQLVQGVYAELGMPDLQNPAAVRTISEELFEEIRTVAETRLAGVEIGKYYLLLALWQEADEPPILQLYSFSLFENDMRSIRQIIDGYRRGEYISRPGTSPETTTIQLTPIQDEDRVTRMAKDLGYT